MYIPQESETRGIFAHIISEQYGICLIFNLWFLARSGVSHPPVDSSALMGCPPPWNLHCFALPASCRKTLRRESEPLRRRPQADCLFLPYLPSVDMAAFMEILLEQSCLQKEGLLIHDVVRFVLNKLICWGLDLGVMEMWSNACHRALAFVL